VWQQLLGNANGAELIDHLRDACKQYCGTAGSPFLEKLVELRRQDAPG